MSQCYRKLLPVQYANIPQSDTVCPVCPRCKIMIEREYMKFCDNCGQKLGWNKTIKAKIVK